MKRILLMLIALAIIVISCKKKTKLPDIPHIGDLRISDTVVKSALQTDTLLITFNYADGGANMKDIILEDIRTDSVLSRTTFSFHDIPPGSIDLDNGAKGTVFLQIPNSLYLIERPDPAHTDGDTLYYRIHITDSNNDSSNKITTPNIYIIP